MANFVILATGPTAKQFPVGLFLGVCRVIVINDAHRLCPQADILYACDYDWWKLYEKDVAGFQGRKISLKWHQSHPIPEYYDYLGREGFSDQPGKLFSGHNSGFQALQVAAQDGAEKVFLAGFDMGSTGNDKHFWGGRHPPQLAAGSDYELFKSDFSNNLEAIRSRMDVKLVTSPSGLDRWFKTVTVEEALRELSTAPCRL